MSAPAQSAPSPSSDASMPLTATFADEALASFARSHTRIVDQMNRLQRLPAQLAQRGLDEDVRASAATIHRFFNDVVLEHHDEEERELFPALRHSAAPGDEAGLVASLVARLEREHRELESMWDRVEPALRRLGRGKSSDLDAGAIEQLVGAYLAHAGFEEAAVLPLASSILSSGDRSALALGLAMRRIPSRIHAYI